MRIRQPWLWSLVGLLACVPLTASASTVPPISFEALVRGADVVFTGEVRQVEPQWVSTPTGRAIVTRVTFHVARTLKGSPRAEVTLEFLGGQVGETALEVPGVPRFTVGERVVVCAREGRPRVSPVVGFHQGRFRVTRDPQTGVERVTAHDGWAFASVGQIGRDRTVTSERPRPAMTLQAFEAEIVRAASERAR